MVRDEQERGNTMKLYRDGENVSLEHKGTKVSCRMARSTDLAVARNILTTKLRKAIRTKRTARWCEQTVLSHSFTLKGV